LKGDTMNGNPNFRMTDDELTRFARRVMNRGEPFFEAGQSLRHGLPGSSPDFSREHVILLLTYLTQL
jgi:hypothetical protein